MDSEAINVRMERHLIEALDRYVSSQNDLSRPEAIRRIVTERLLPHANHKPE